MPLSEYYRWMSYFRYEEPDVEEMQLAVLSTLVSNGLGGKSKVKDFLIRQHQETTQTTGKQQGMSSEDVKRAFMGVAIKTK